MAEPTLSTAIAIRGFGRQRVYPPVGRCIYCFVTDCDLGDEHIIPQALGGNIILRSASCSDCERIIGAGVEQRLTHKTKGMFAAMRLRHNYKSKRPKTRPSSLPFTIIEPSGFHRRVHIPAKMIPRYWLAFVSLGPPGIIVGRSPNAGALGAAYWQWHEDDIKGLSRIVVPGARIQLHGAGDARDLNSINSKDRACNGRSRIWS